MVKSGQSWSGVIVCKDSTGALSTPTVGPVGTLYVNGVANGASVTVTGTNPYKWVVTLPALTAGQTVSMYITATIAGVATAAIVAETDADTSRVSDVAATIGAAGAGLTALATAAELTAAQTAIQVDVATRAAPGDGMALVNDAITSAKFDESTAFPLKSADAGTTQIARTGADGDTLETLSDQIDLIPTDAGIQAECEDALKVYDLDHLFKVSPGSTKPVAGTYWDQITSKDSNQTFNRATDSLEVLGEKLAQASITVVSTVSGSEITVYRDTKWVISLTGVGDLSDRATSGARLYFTAKVNPDEDTNDEAILQVEESQGLLVFNGSDDVTALDGSITVTDENDGDLTITVKTATTSNAPLITSISADVKMVDTSGEEHRMRGYRFNIKATETR